MASPDENPVRAIHDAVADSSDDVEASTRPPGTTRGELRRMVADVLDKLDVNASTTAVEIGCGTGILAVPIAGAAARFVGVDFSTLALASLREKFEAAGVGAKVELVELDILTAPAEAIAALGTFDRVLVYAALHYVAGDDELNTFLDRAVALAAPTGLVLLGSLPVADAPVRRSRFVGKAYAAWRRAVRTVRRRPDRPSPSLPPGTTMVLTAEKLERWLHGRPDLRAEWRAPRVGTPMWSRRADLLIRRAAR